ncbi:NAD-dependent epimerase/dehydratase family protein [Chloroflexota bacterium]
MITAVTGANGHVGANLVRALVAGGRPTRSLVHINRRSISGLGTEIIICDVREQESLCRAFDGVDVVYHLAANISITMKEWPLLEWINVIGTRNVVEACLRSGVRRLVHFSSIHALVQEPLGTPVDEARPLVASRHSPPYDRSKALADKEVLSGIEKGLDAVIINPTAIIGPNDYQLSYIGEALLAMANGKLPAMVAGGYDWVDVRDIVEGAMRAEEQAKSGERYILSGHWVSIRDIAAMVSEITGVSTPGFVCPLWLARLGAPILHSFSNLREKWPLYTSVSMRALKSNHSISHEKAANDLGYQPRPFRETMIDTLRWYGDNGHLNDSAVVKAVESR